LCLINLYQFNICINNKAYLIWNIIFAPHQKLHFIKL
jgi:hypothetical protein